MKILKKSKEVVEYVVGLKCDMCGKTYTDCFDTQEFFSFSNIGGYSSVFGDNVEISMDICQHCMKKIINTFGIDIYEH